MGRQKRERKRIAGRNEPNFHIMCRVFMECDSTQMHLSRQIFRRRIMPTHEDKHALTHVFSLNSDTESVEQAQKYARMQIAEQSTFSMEAQAARVSIATSRLPPRPLCSEQF